MSALIKTKLAAITLALITTSGLYAQVEIGPPTDDVWCYIRSADPGGDPIIRVWGDEGMDLNPTGYPGAFGTEDFYSHGFMSWAINDLPRNYRWNGATVVFTVVEGTVYDPATDEVYLRLLTDGFDENTWQYGVGAEPIDGNNRKLRGDDSRIANGPGSTVTFTIPRNIPDSVLRQWARNRRIDLALTSTADFDSDNHVLRVASKENQIFDPPTLILH